MRNTVQEFTTLVPTLAIVLKEVKQKMKLRPWKANEVPIGAMFKGYEWRGNQRIVGYNPRYSCIYSPAILLSNFKYEDGDDHYFINDLVTSLMEPKYSWDGVTWYDCGVWEPVTK